MLSPLRLSNARQIIRELSESGVAPSSTLHRNRDAIGRELGLKHLAYTCLFRLEHVLKTILVGCRLKQRGASR